MLEWLKTILGDTYTEDIDKKVSAEIGKEFVARTDFNAVNETKKELDKTIRERDAQLEELKKVDAAGLQAKITELQESNNQAKTQYEETLKKTRLDFLLENRLIKEGAVNTKAVKALLEASKITLDGENLVGVDDQLKALKESEKWAFQQQTPGRTQMPQGGNPPAGDSLDDVIKSAVYGSNT